MICNISTCTASLCKAYFHCYEISGPWSLRSDHLFNLFHQKKLHLSNEKIPGRLAYVGILPSFVETMIKHINHEIKDPYLTSSSFSWLT